MLSKLRVIGVFGAVFVLSGCLHGRGAHHIPVERDYKNLEAACLDESRDLVAKAHRVGAHHFAPYENESATHYLAFAEDARAEGDRKGERDYAGLARRYANAAIEKGGIPDKGELAMLKDREAARAEFERLKARYLELNACKAKIVAPSVYAHIEANLAQAEHELNECHFQTPEIVRHLRLVEPDIDAIWAKDTDGDGVHDMEDGEPWIPEDKDGYDDGDGIPEPKPYPVLEDVNFATNKSNLSADDQGYLRGVADMLNDGYSEATVNLTAHTDSDASDEYNQGLSQRREAAVRDYLIANGVKQEIVVSSHHGEGAPKADNSSAAGKAQNRRVEIKLDSVDPVSPYCK